jgi:cytochrome c peroxidase
MTPATGSGGAITFFTGLTPTSVAFRGQDLLVFFRGAGALIVVPASGHATFATQLMPDTGHELFHTATFNQIACASCHPEGGDDGHVWQFTAGARRTPSLRGGLTGTEPFHWSGDESNMDNLMADVFTTRMGGMLEPPARVKQLIGWLDSLPARPPPSDLDLAAVTRGASAFSSLGCGSCHAGALGTDNSTVDVGTGDKFQVPRLVEMAYRAPFLHDGSAATLADRFTALGGVNHPGSSGLTAGEIDDLVAYLKSR